MMVRTSVQSYAETRLMPEPRQIKNRNGWFYWYKDENAKWRQKKGGDTKEQAWASVIAKERELQPVRLGLIDSKTFQQQKYSKKPIEEVIIQFEGNMRGNRCSETHIKGIIGDICMAFGVEDPAPDRRARRAAAQGYRPRACNWTCLADVSASEFKRFLDDVARVRSAVRRNRYRTAVYEIVNWAVDLGWMPYNPLKTIGKLDEDTDVRRPRRPISEEEVWQLIDATAKRKRGGAKRSLYYWVAFKLGLRWTEINRIKRHQLDLGDNPCLVLEASNTKSGKAAVMPIPDDLAQALRDSLGHSLVLFNTKPSPATWKRDLKAAEIDYKTVDGGAYRGATRTTFATHLYRAGVDLRTSQELMRHSDPKLTSKVYQKVRLLDTRPAVERLSRPKKTGQKGCA